MDAPMVTVTAGSVLVDGIAIWSANALRDAGAVMPIPELTSMMMAKRDIYPTVASKPKPRHCLLQIDDDTPVVVVKSVFAASAAAGFTDIGFLVHQLPESFPGTGPRSP